jgi:hypothetical protein
MMQLPESQLRFLRAIAERIPVERVIEVHLFPPLRQGRAETGAAVVAAISDGPRPDSVVVYAAHYKHAIKGTDRGTWTVEVTVEADAPLETVSDVVRGVERRSADRTEAADAVRFDGEAFRALIGVAAPAPGV